MKITFPELSLVVLIGASGSGKSTFAHTHFRATEILSSDFFRGMVADDETDQSASRDAFDVLHYIAAKRLAAGRLTVIDATNVQADARKPLLKLAKEYHFFTVAIALDLPETLCHERNQQRPDRQFGSHVVRRHVKQLKQSLRSLKREGFRFIYTLSSLAEINAVEIERQPLWNNRQQDQGPFDIIGDVHGCGDELETLLQTLGYQATPAQDASFWAAPTYTHPEGRKALFLGDLVDRGPRILDTVKLVRTMVASDSALCILGNHENKLLRHLAGKRVKINHGLEHTLAEIAGIAPEQQPGAIAELQAFLQSLISHYVLDQGRLVVAHAGLREDLQGRGSARVRDFALYGETTGEIDEFGLPVRYNWAAEYRGQAMVVYGHTPVPEAEWLNRTIDIDTGCVFGGRLTALRYPEKELVSVPAQRIYCEPVGPLTPNAAVSGAAFADGDLLDINDVMGRRRIVTRLQGPVTLLEGQAIAALEVISRFAVNPRWLIYLPPTMSPTATSQLPGLLEHPAEAFAYYRKQGIQTVMCEEKHMGSRAVVVLCRDEETVAQRFGLRDVGIGICYTRTGRRFFDQPELEAAFLERLQLALTQSGFWEQFQTRWVCLDCELMPWSAKAQALLQQQYAPVGAAASQALSEAVKQLQAGQERGLELNALLGRYRQRSELAQRYVSAYRRYCWPVQKLTDLKLAPFHILATEGAVHTDKPHDWHMAKIAHIAQQDLELLMATSHRLIELNNDGDRADGAHWWDELTAAGGEGMVVKPLSFIAHNGKKLAQPAIKCRGAEYLRLIYGPEYSLPENLERLRQRGLSTKRSLALREFALGIEALERFVAQAPLRDVHECVFGVLALESEPVDPRL